MNPDGNVVLITGAARGIGAEVARVLASHGARLALAGLEPDRLAALAAELGSAHACFECDVTDQAALELAVVPGIPAPVAALRFLPVNPPLDVLVRREAKKTMPGLEQEAASLGRSFGAHSAELTRRVRR
jgi:NADP-dependent 3-hydroxy acid dehydrogenase YdfG